MWPDYVYVCYEQGRGVPGRKIASLLSIDCCIIRKVAKQALKRGRQDLYPATAGDCTLLSFCPQTRLLKRSAYIRG